MVDRPVLGSDLETPRKVGRAAEELLVPPVAEAADPLRDEKRGRDAVGELRDGDARAPRDDRPDDTAEPDPAPDAEAALPDRERPPPLVRQLVPARDDVVEPRADDSGGDAPHRDAEDEIPVAAAPRPADSGDRRPQRRWRRAASGRRSGSRAARARSCSTRATGSREAEAPAGILPTHGRAARENCPGYSNIWSASSTVHPRSSRLTAAWRSMSWLAARTIAASGSYPARSRAS